MDESIRCQANTWSYKDHAKTGRCSRRGRLFDLGKWVCRQHTKAWSEAYSPRLCSQCRAEGDARRRAVAQAEHGH